ncbi:MAG: hypothetical protein ACFFBI_07885, partial [Promethearchaeota archaeon]
THIMIITAFAGKNYEFEDYTIIISVATRPGIDWTWLIIILGSSALVLVTAFVLYQKHFKFPPLVRKIRKLKKKISKDRKVKPVILHTREDLVETRREDNLEIMGITTVKKGEITKIAPKPLSQNQIKQGGDD